MTDISIIKFGTLTVEYGESFNEKLYNLGKYLGRIGDSSVIRVENDGKYYLIDTGFSNEADLSPENLLYNKLDLQIKLQVKKLNFEDIDGIFITHWHADHFANLHLFPNATVYCYQLFNKYDFQKISERYNFQHLLPIRFLDDSEEFAGCKIFPTPGHTEFHCSLLMNFRQQNIVIAGDAIVSQSYFHNNTAWPYNSGNLGEQACINSMLKIISVADYIIPGHGHPFQNYRKSELE